MASFRLDHSPDLSPAPPARSADQGPADAGGRLGRLLAARIARMLGDTPVGIVLPDGTRVVTREGPLLATLTFRDLGVLPGLLVNPGLVFGQAYEAGRIEVAGDLVGLLESVYRHQAAAKPLGRWRQVAVPPARIDPRTARRNIHHHYDLGNDFYRLWLDREMLYTCAYYESPSADLDMAQAAKMDLVCRKLRLRPGERVVEAGCGWGALALHMARRYGVTVRAFNISAEQVRYARDRARHEGIAGRVEFVEDDYLAIRGSFDVFVSVGMLEHVGPSNYRTLGRVIWDSLPAPGGRGLIHFIGRTRPHPLNPWIRFRIFPGAYPPTLSEMVRGVLEPWNFSVLDVENLRLHYARTLRHWLERFDAAADRVSAMFDERFIRAWRLYLAGSRAAFAAGSLHLFQVVFARGGDNQIPWTRPGQPPLDPAPRET